MRQRLSIRLQRPGVWVWAAALVGLLAGGGWLCLVGSPGGSSQAVPLMALDAQPGAKAVSTASAKGRIGAARAVHAATGRTKEKAGAVKRVSAANTAGRSHRVADSGRVHRFNGRRLVKVKTMHMLVTAYTPGERSCGKWADGVTASGYSVWTNGMKLVAADTRLLPFGTIVSIPGYDHGKPVPVLDRGGKIKGRHLDVLYSSRHRALDWGVKHLTVTVWKYARD